MRHVKGGHFEQRKGMSKKGEKTITLNAQMVISKTETGVDLVQVIPDEPCEGVVTPFNGWGFGQLLGNALFNFVRKTRIRLKPELKVKYGSLSYGQDGFDRLTIVVPSGMRNELPAIIMEVTTIVINYLKQKFKA